MTPNFGLDPDELLTDPEQLAFYSSDVYSRGITVAAVLQPRDIERCARAIGEATRAGYAVIPRGGGLSYTGGYLARDPRSVIIDTSRLDRIVAIEPDDLYITVEAGVSWKRIHEALKPLGLRLPFFGTFSGAQATVGGGLSNGALFYGTARYGTAADAVLGLEVALADGQIVHTGQRAFRQAQKPFYRTCGPDLSGVFLHDTGALGIKLRATLRLIRAPAHTGYASFVFADIHAAASALSELARTGAAEEAYVFDPQSTEKNLRSAGLMADAGALVNVIRQERGWRGLLAGWRLMRAGREFVPANSYSLHVTAAARSQAALDADLGACRVAAAQYGGREIADSIPRAVRANLFPPPEAVLGPDGDRWAALNAKVAHSDASAIIRASEAMLAPYQDRMRAEGVWMSHLLIAIGAQAFSFEPVFHWHDEWLPLHRHHASPALREAVSPPAKPGAAALVHEMRACLVQLFASHGAASNQLGKTYPYLSALRPETAALVQAVKSAVDPSGKLNPGALELSRG